METTKPTPEQIEAARKMVQEADEAERAVKFHPKGSTIVGREKDGYWFGYQVWSHEFSRERYVSLNDEEMAGFNLLMERALRREGK